MSRAKIPPHGELVYMCQKLKSRGKDGKEHAKVCVCVCVCVCVRLRVHFVSSLMKTWHHPKDVVSVKLTGCSYSDAAPLEKAK